MAGTTNYVKFLRGSKSAYQSKIENGTIDKDTLYFIYENKEATTGQLYLGTKLISGGMDLSSATFNDFKDVVINNIGDKQVLIYDADTETWRNSNINSAIGVMVGATTTTDGATGLVPTPTSKDYKRFLRGDGTWANIPTAILNGESIENLEDIIASQLDEQLKDLNDKIAELEDLINNGEDSDEDDMGCCCKNRFRVINQKLADLENKMKAFEDALSNLPEQDKPAKDCCCAILNLLAEKINTIMAGLGDLDKLYDYRNGADGEDGLDGAINIVEAINTLFVSLQWQNI